MKLQVLGWLPDGGCEQSVNNLLPNTRYQQGPTRATHQAFCRDTTLTMPHEVTRTGLQAFVMAMRERGLTAVSCNTYLKAINAFLAWLHAEGQVAERLRLPALRTEKRVVRTLAEPHLRQLLAFKPKGLARWRAYVLVCLLLDTGLRPAQTRLVE